MDKFISGVGFNKPSKDFRDRESATKTTQLYKNTTILVIIDKEIITIYFFLFA